MSTTATSIRFAASAILAVATLRQIIPLAKRFGSIPRPRRYADARLLPLPALLMLCVVVSDDARAQDPGAADAASLATARAAIKGLGETLKTQLVAAIKSGGPVAAVGVCRTIAPQIAKDQSRAHGVSIARTALKVRNPANAPDAFERRVLEAFARQIEAGADAAKLEHAETVTDGGERMFRYMKAIPTAAEPCLTCHGSNLEPAISTEIFRLYPDDQATGFAAGSLRGAFTVKQKLK